MHAVLKRAGLAAIGVGAAVAAASMVGVARWNRETAALVEGMTGAELPRAAVGPEPGAGALRVVADAAQESEPADSPIEHITSDDAVPLPVARYLRRSLSSGATRPAWITLEQRGEFRMGADPDSWRPFRATHAARLDPPGFVWDAKIRMAPLVTVRVRDSYMGGRAGMTARMAGLVTVMDAPSEVGLVTGAFYRFLAEAPWYPPRLQPGNGLSWQEVDDSTAVAILTDGAVRASVTFHFDATGDIVRISAIRPEAAGDTFVDRPWVGRFSDHRVIDGFRVPTRGEVAWVRDGAEYPYWRGEVIALRLHQQP